MKMREKFFAKVLMLLIGILFIAGCGQSDGGSKNPTERINEFQVLSAEGYYGDLRMQPNGVFLVRNKMTEAESLTAGVVYKVELNEANKINKITAMQGGIPISINWRDTMNNKFQFAAVTIEYLEDRVRYNFRSSRMEATPGFYDAYSIAYKVGEDKKNFTVAYMYNKDGDQSNANRGYAQMFFSYDDKGNLSKLAFADDGGNRVININKEYELHFKYGNKPGLITEIANYGKDGALMAAANGIAKTTFKLDDKNRVVEVKHFGTDEALKDKNNPNLELSKALTSMSAGAITRYSHDDTDRVRKISFLGKDEQAEGIKDWGNISSFNLTYTPEGWLASIASFATDDTPIALDKNLFGDNVVKLGFERDNFGNLVKVIFYGKEDNPVTSSKLGAAERRYKYDEKRRQTGQEYYGTGGEKIEINDTAKGFKYHGFTYEYNDDDERTLVIYYDTNANEVRRENLTTRSSEVDSGKLTAPPQPVAPTPMPTGVYEARVDNNIDFLALRTGPSANDSLITKIPPGSYIEIIRDGENFPTGFVRARYNGMPGFVSSRYITVNQRLRENSPQPVYANEQPRFSNSNHPGIETLVNFHGYITNRNFRSAFNCLSYPFQNRMDYGKWVSGFDTTVSSSVSDIQIVNSGGDYVVVSYILTAVDRPIGTHRYRGTATIIYTPNGWKIDKVKNTGI